MAVAATNEGPIRRDAEAALRTAFRGVCLGDGISLRQAQAMDTGSHPMSDREFGALPDGEITDDWSRVPLEEMERDCVAHLDAKGLRYYLPALLISLLDHYDPGSMRVIGTIGELCPRSTDLGYHLSRHSLLSMEQRAAVACFLSVLPELVTLDADDQKRVRRAVRNYWQEHLPAAPF